MTITSVIAQSPYQNRLEGLRGAFHNRKTDPADVTAVLIFFGAVIAIAVIWAVVRRISTNRKEESGVTSPVRLFDGVLRRMGIGFQDRFLLRLFARGTGLSQPALVLFDENTFDHHANRWIDSLSIAPLKRRAGVGIALLRDRAFPDAKPEPSDNEDGSDDSIGCVADDAKEAHG